MPEQTDATGDILGSIFDLAKTWSTPFVQSLKQGEQSKQSDEQSVFNEKMDWNALNGSGPVDNETANQAPRSLMDYILGNRVSAKAGASANTNGGMDYTPMIVIGGILLVVVLWLAKRG